MHSYDCLYFVDGVHMCASIRKTQDSRIALRCNYLPMCFTTIAWVPRHVKHPRNSRKCFGMAPPHVDMGNIWGPNPIPQHLKPLGNCVDPLVLGHEVGHKT